MGRATSDRDPGVFGGRASRKNDWRGGRSGRKALVAGGMLVATHCPPRTVVSHALALSPLLPLLLIIADECAVRATAVSRPPGNACDRVSARDACQASRRKRAVT